MNDRDAEPPRPITWFEIPVENVDRSMEFYRTVLGCEFTVDDETDDTYPMFTAPSGEVYGVLIPAGEHPIGGADKISYAPGPTGLLVYLTVGGDLDDALDAVGPAGGEVRVDKLRAPDGARYAIVIDSEGNRIGLMADG